MSIDGPPPRDGSGELPPGVTSRAATSPRADMADDRRCGARRFEWHPNLRLAVPLRISGNIILAIEGRIDAV
jgi:hypothetical protein